MDPFKIKTAKLAALKSLAGNNDEPKPYSPGRPIRMLRREEVRSIDKPMSFNLKKMKPIY